MKFSEIKGILTFAKVKEDKEFVTELQTLLKEGGFYGLKVDGIWGKGTDAAVKAAADKFSLNNYEKQRFGKSYYNALVRHNRALSRENASRKQAKVTSEGIFTIKPIKEREISEAKLKEVADLLGCELAAIKAVAEVESNGSSFLRDGRIKILFEAHIFSGYTNDSYSDDYPLISSKKWNRSLYKGGAAEYPRLQQAMELNREAALKSCSYGGFQIMGFNYKICGFNSIDTFVKEMHTGDGQLKALANFIIRRGLADELRRKDWAGFARGYNGKGYKANRYDEKLAAAYKKFS